MEEEGDALASVPGILLTVLLFSRGAVPLQARGRRRAVMERWPSESSGDETETRGGGNVVVQSITEGDLVT